VSADRVHARLCERDPADRLGESERFGAKRVWIVSLLLYMLGSGLAAAWSIGSVIAFRVVQGLGAGMILPFGQTIFAQAAGPQRMGRVMSVVGVPLRHRGREKIRGCPLAARSEPPRRATTTKPHASCGAGLGSHAPPSFYSRHHVGHGVQARTLRTENR
jgi:hypothetical protein